MKIYLAGKINGKEDWRFDVVNGLQEANSKITIEKNDFELLNFPTLNKSIFNQFDYVGPYFCRLDEGLCEEQEHSGGHGCPYVIEGGDKWDHPLRNQNHINLKECEKCKWLSQPTIVHACLNAIHYCDIFFFYWDDYNSFGSYLELGYALALNKEIILGTDGKREFNSDYWFIPYSLHSGIGSNCSWIGKGEPRELLKKYLIEKEYLKEDNSKLTYFIKAGSYVKIGCSDNPEKRVKTLQTGNPETLELIYTSQLPESQLQEKFKQYHTHGEWYYYSKEIQDFIDKDMRVLGGGRDE